MGLPFVDDTKTMSNNVWDIYDTLGVEAACQFLVEEFMQLCSGINKCHIQLLADKMTHGGAIASISRYSMRNEDCGPMGKAPFEETMDNFLRAGAYGQKESTNGVSASIICGKRANIGTGVCELMMDVKALPNNVRVLHNVEEKMNMSEYNTAMTVDISMKNKPIVSEFENKRDRSNKPKLKRVVNLIDGEDEGDVSEGDVSEGDVSEGEVSEGEVSEDDIQQTCYLDF